MAQFAWTEDLYTGNPLIDGDHSKLAALVNVLFEAMEGARANDAMCKAMNDVIAYTNHQNDARLRRR